MRLFAAMLVLAAAAVCSEARAQQAYWPQVMPGPGESLVRDPVIVVPEFDRESEVVAYRVHVVGLDESDLPFFIDLVGIAIARAGAEAYVRKEAVRDSVAVFLCSLRAGEAAFDMTDPDDRREHCSLRRDDSRQP